MVCPFVAEDVGTGSPRPLHHAALTQMRRPIKTLPPKLLTLEMGTGHAAVIVPAARFAAKSTNQRRLPGLAIVSGLATFSIGWPSRIFLTGTSSFLPDSVRGTSATVKISLGTTRADTALRIA